MYYNILSKKYNLSKFEKILFNLNKRESKAKKISLYKSLQNHRLKQDRVAIGRNKTSIDLSTDVKYNKHHLT